MSGDCPNCGALEAENAQLRAENGNLRAGIRSIVAFIHRENKKPTMPRQKLIPTITARLNDLAGR